MFGVPYSETEFTALFEVYKLDWLAGKVTVLSATAAIKYGASLGQICMNNSCTDFSFSPVKTEFVDISAINLAGKGIIKNKRKTCCSD